MKKLTLIVLLALAGCGKPEIPRNTLLVPDYLCTQTPTKETRQEPRSVYCGKGCTRQQDFTQHAVNVSCEYKEWRDE